MAADLAVDFTKDEPVVSGECLLLVQKAVVGESGAGNLKIDLHLKVQDADDSSEYVGRMVFDTLTFTAKTMWRVKAALKGLHFKASPGEQIVNKEFLTMLATKLIGLSSWCLVTTQEGTGEYEGTVRSQVKRYGIKRSA